MITHKVEWGCCLRSPEKVLVKIQVSFQLIKKIRKGFLKMALLCLALKFRSGFDKQGLGWLFWEENIAWVKTLRKKLQNKFWGMLVLCGAWVYNIEYRLVIVDNQDLWDHRVGSWVPEWGVCCETFGQRNDNIRTIFIGKQSESNE